MNFTLLREEVWWVNVQLLKAGLVSLTSPHTIHPDAKPENLIDFADMVGVTFNDGLGQFVDRGVRTLPGTV